ncbi:DNA polymerase I [Rhodohalobacter barkolensis]|uniref:DNA polymerase I n=1 Tax=Rhodohalobacter barkolensis TaxID=2053187 RepID=A0A2N0VKW1_9BACT|nr:DNA polymerase I [Rhodohalobacter barkolensis]PKD44837.1 DNA polymerase I [Rhodohalobacter barkolensis]
MAKKKLYLLDGMALAYRAHFAFINSRLKNSEGIATGPILGFANTLAKLLEEEKPTHIAVAWDTHAPTFRHDLDETYKANRPPQPEELKVGIPLIKEMVEKFGIDNIEQDGYEADDIIGTIAYNAQAEHVDVYLVTPDKDFMQLVDDHITMIKPDNKNGGFIVIDRDGVQDYFGVGPEKVIDVLAIIGDTSDNIPGVKGIGKKGAPKLINKYGSLEKAIEQAPNMKSKRHRTGLTEYAEQAMHAKEMVSIKIDVPDVQPWEDLVWEGPDKKELGLFFKRMEFRTLTRKYLGEEPGGQGTLFGSGGEEENENGSLNEEAVLYSLAVTEEDILAVVKQLENAKAICFDTETDSPDPINANLVGISLSAKPEVAWYIPVNVEDALPQEKVKELLKPIFENIESTKIAHNYKFDYLILKRAGFKIKGDIFDTMVAAYLLDANQRLKMDSLAKKYLKYEPVPIESLIGKGKNQKSMADIPYKEISSYACEDADITYRLYVLFADELKEDELLSIADNLEFPLIEVLGDMEEKGVKIDVEMLEMFSEELNSDIEKLEKEIFEKTGEEFNLNSPKQLGEVLFEKMEIPAGKKTKTGQYSTSEAVLSELSNEYEVPAMVLDYRSLSKLKSTYVDALPKLVNPNTGRIHTDFNQTVAATGRLSSSNPNLQNIPIRTERGREIRKAFVPEDGFKLLAADYSQVELRVIASISGDQNMTEAFKNGEDIHARTAKEIFNLDSLDEVTPNQRRKAKEVNFGIPYGVSAYGLASRLGISNSEGKEMIDQYFERFPGIKTYIDDTIEYAKEHGYVSTLMGRRRYIPDINSKNWNVRGFAERTAINMPIQGTAADIIKLAMIHIHDYLLDENLKSRMLLQVHDELIFEIHEDERDHVPEKIKTLMEKAYQLDVPLDVEMGLAENWLEAH